MTVKVRGSGSLTDHLALACISLALLLHGSHALSAEESVEKWAYASTVEETRNADDGNADTAFSDSKSKVTVNLSDKESIASLRYSTTSRNGSAFTQFDWGLSVPFKKDEVSALSLSGPAPDAEISLTASKRFKKFFGKDLGDVTEKDLDVYLDSVWNLRKPICEEYAKAVFERSFTALADDPVILNMNSCNNALFTERNFEKSPKIKRLRLQKKYAELRELEDLRATKEREFFRDPESTKENPTYRRPDALKSFGLQVKAGQKAFKYVTTDDLAKSKSDQNAVYSGTVFGSWLRRGTLVGAGVQYRRFYEAGKEGSVCAPVGATTTLTCTNKIIGKPAQKEAKIAFLEARKVFGSALIGVSPRAEYDVKEGEWSIRVPVYGPITDIKDLRFGLSLGWGSKEDESEAAVFFSKAFSLTDFGF